MQTLIKTKPGNPEVYKTISAASRATGIPYNRIWRAVTKKGYYEDLEVRIEKIKIVE